MKNLEVSGVEDVQNSSALGLYVPPPMTIEQYARLQGVSQDTLNNQIKRGYVPTIKVGKRRLINTFAIANECLRLGDEIHTDCSAE